MSDPLLPLATWLGTYLLHSTVLLGFAWAIDRWRLLRSPALCELLWRAAMIGALVTATAQSAGLAQRAPMASLLSFTPRTAPPAPSGIAGEVASEDSPTSVAATTAIAANEPARPSLHPTDSAGAGSRAASSGQWMTLRLPRLIALLWLAGAAFLILRLAAHGWRTRRDLVGRAPGDASLRRELASICGVQRLSVPTLSVTSAIAGPVALPNGEIVLPPWVSELLDARQRRAVLAHELAHQVRRDPQWMVLALALDAFLWLQPLHRLARRRLGALAELEADAWAARLLCDPRALAESLAACAERLFANRVALWSAGMVTGPSQDCPLLERIDRLLKGSAMTHPKSTWPARAGALAVLSAGIFLLPGCGPAGFGEIGGGSSTSISISDDGDTRMSVRRPGYSMKMESDGELTFAGDESDVAALSAGGTFSLTEKVAGVEHVYKVKADAAGRLERTFSRDGDELALDAEARQWLAEALPRMFRESGLDADARVGRLLARGGPELVLAEIDLAVSDHAKSTYLGRLLGTVQLDAQQFERALASAAKLGSDHELRTALELGLSTQALDSARVTALLATAKQLDSDFELRSLLERVAPRGGDPEVAASYLSAARELDSDFERRSALVALLEGAKLDGAGLAEALEVASGLGSDFEKRTVLELLASSVAADPDLNRRYRDVARGMSDFERGEALRALDDAMSIQPGRRAAI